MNKNELLHWLDKANIRPDCYDLDGKIVNEAYVLGKTSAGWEVFYSERGLRTGRRTFASEVDACECLKDLISRDVTTRCL